MVTTSSVLSPLYPHQPLRILHQAHVHLCEDFIFFPWVGLAMRDCCEFQFSSLSALDHFAPLRHCMLFSAITPSCQQTWRKSFSASSPLWSLNTSLLSPMPPFADLCFPASSHLQEVWSLCWKPYSMTVVIALPSPIPAFIM